MFELSIFCVVLLAAGYWVAMWLMGRRDDVLHGRFVDPDAGLAAEHAVAPPPFPPRPSHPAPPAKEPKRVNSDALQSLLAAIQQDLRDVA